jgi:hypothetical protein
MERLKAEAGDSLNVIGVHYYDTYAIPEAESLAAHYQVAGTPTTWFDGIDVQFYSDTATYWGYRGAFDKRKTEQPLAVLALSGWADTTERTGNLACSVANPAADSMSARLRLALVERAIYRPWGGGDSVFDVMRRMVPDFRGIELRLAPGADTSFSQPFSMPADWRAEQLEAVAWVEGQEGGSPGRNGAILQSARLGNAQLCGAASAPDPGPTASSAMSAAAFPNPVREHGTIRFALGRPGNVKAAFYDVAGRRLAVMDLGWRGAGEHRAAFRTGGWPAGIVLCRVETVSSSRVIAMTHLD